MISKIWLAQKLCKHLRAVNIIAKALNVKKKCLIDMGLDYGSTDPSLSITQEYVSFQKLEEAVTHRYIKCCYYSGRMDNDDGFVLQGLLNHRYDIVNCYISILNNKLCGRQENFAF